MLSVYPRSVQVTTGPGVSQSLENSTPVEEIARFPWTVIWNDTNGIYNNHHRVADIKAMRKLKSGDEIVLGYVCSVASDSKMVANVYMWFKE